MQRKLENIIRKMKIETAYKPCGSSAKNKIHSYKYI